MKGFCNYRAGVLVVDDAIFGKPATQMFHYLKGVLGGVLKEALDNVTFKLMGGMCKLKLKFGVSSYTQIF